MITPDIRPPARLNNIPHDQDQWQSELLISRREYRCHLGPSRYPRRHGSRSELHLWSEEVRRYWHRTPAQAAMNTRSHQRLVIWLCQRMSTLISKLCLATTAPKTHLFSAVVAPAMQQHENLTTPLPASTSHTLSSAYPTVFYACDSCTCHVLPAALVNIRPAQ